MELRLFEVSELYAEMLLFDWERAAEVLQAWREWTATVPDEVTSIGHVVQFPPLPEIPEPLRGRSIVTIEAAYLGDEASGIELLRPLRELGPEMDTFAMVPPAALLALHMDPPGPVPAMGNHAMLGELTAEAVDAFVAAVGPRSGSPLVTAELRHLGGALARRADDGGALGTIDGAYAFFGAGVVVDGAASAGAVAAQLERAKGALAPWFAGREYLNFVEHPVDTSGNYDEADYAVLREIRAQVDPEELFRANHPIPPAR
jgi:berberine-like enzyme